MIEMRRMESAKPERGFSITRTTSNPTVTWGVSAWVKNDDQTITLYVDGRARQTKRYDPRTGDYVDPLELLLTDHVMLPQVYTGIDVAVMWAER